VCACEHCRCICQSQDSSWVGCRGPCCAMRSALHCCGHCSDCLLFDQICFFRFIVSDLFMQIRTFVCSDLFIHIFSSDSILQIRLLKRCQDSSQRLDASFGQAVALELQSQCLRMVRTHLLKCLVFVCFLLRVLWVVMHSFAQNSFSYLFVQICSLIVAQVSSLFARFSLHLFAQTHILSFTNRC
jgi:hypothetical protein